MEDKQRTRAKASHFSPDIALASTAADRDDNLEAVAAGK